MVHCSECDAILDVEEDEISEGDELTCEECGANLRVTSTDPVELELADEEDDEDEDFDDEEDFDEDGFDDEDEEDEL